MNSVLDSTKNGIHEQWKIRTVDYVKKPLGFFFRRITTFGRDSSPSRKAAVRLKKTFSRTAGYRYLRRLCTQAHDKGSRYASAVSQQETASPLTPWIYGILDFCNVRVYSI
jgi:hypothetical protein